MKPKRDLNSVKYIPLTQNQEKAKQLLFHTFKCFPFNKKHPNYQIYLKDRTDTFKSHIWSRIWFKMNDLGNLNNYLLHPSEDFNNFSGFNNPKYYPSITSQDLVERIINLVIPKIPSKHSNHEYHETPLFSIAMDFFLILYSFLLPEGVSWKDYLVDPHVGTEFYFYFKPIIIKEISEKWEKKINAKSDKLRLKYLKEMIDSNDPNIDYLKNRMYNNDYDGYNQKLSAIVLAINDFEKLEEIPINYRSNKDQIIKVLNDLTSQDFSMKPKNLLRKIVNPLNFFSNAGTSFNRQLNFGLSPNIFQDIVQINHLENERYEYILLPQVEVILTPEQFQNQINEIFKLYYGHANIQLDSDGILRYRQSKYENLQTHSLIESFVSKTLSSLVPQLDGLLIAEEKGDWKEIVKKCRILLEDYCREVLNRKRIKFSSDATLVSLLKTLREHSKKLFKFPNWLIKDPFGYFDEYIISLRFMAIVLNPNNHTDSIKVSKKEALGIKNSVISIMITLTGILK